MIAKRCRFVVASCSLAIAMASAGCKPEPPASQGSTSQGTDKPVTADKAAAPAAAPAPAPAAEPAAKPVEAEKIKLTINDFGVFGYKALYAEYQKSHPNIEIVESVNEYN